LDGSSIVEQTQLDSMSHYDPQNGYDFNVISDVEIHYNDDCVLDSISYNGYDDLKVSFKYVFDNDEIFKKSRAFGDDGSWIDNETFDSLGRLIKRNWSNTNGNSFGDGDIFRKYDDSGRILVDDFSSRGTGNLGTIRRTRDNRNSYNDDGLLIFQTNYSHTDDSVFGSETRTDSLEIIYDGLLKQKESLSFRRTEVSSETGSSITTSSKRLEEKYYSYSNDSLIEVLIYKDSLFNSTIRYDYMLNDTTITYFDRDDVLISKEEIRNLGSTRSYIEYERDGTTLIPVIQILQERNSDDSLVLMATYEYDNQQWELSEKLEYLYDINGNLLQSSRTTSYMDSLLRRRSFIYTYNSENQITSESYRYDNALDSILITRLNKEYFYDSEGLLTSLIDNNFFINWAASPIVDTMRFTYNEYGQQTRKQFHLNDWNRYFSPPPCHEPSALPVIEDTSSPLKIFPNPAFEAFEISVDKNLSQDNARVCIYDLSGRLLETNSFDSDRHRSARIGHDLDQGSYIIALFVDGKILASKKAVKI